MNRPDTFEKQLAEKADSSTKGATKSRSTEITESVQECRAASRILDLK